jgi:hypothetical protein
MKRAVETIGSTIEELCRQTARDWARARDGVLLPHSRPSERRQRPVIGWRPPPSSPRNADYYVAVVLDWTPHGLQAVNRPGIAHVAGAATPIRAVEYLEPGR